MSFESELLKHVVSEIRTKYPDVDVKKAWVIKSGRQWEFHYPGFYWNGRAENSYDAKAKGWEAFMRRRERGVGNPEMDGATKFKLIAALKRELHDDGTSDERAQEILKEIRAIEKGGPKPPPKPKKGKLPKERYMTVLGGYVLDMHDHGKLIGHRDEEGNIIRRNPEGTAERVKRVTLKNPSFATQGYVSKALTYTKPELTKLTKEWDNFAKRMSSSRFNVKLTKTGTNELILSLYEGEYLEKTIVSFTKSAKGATYVPTHISGGYGTVMPEQWISDMGYVR